MYRQIRQRMLPLTLVIVFFAGCGPGEDTESEADPKKTSPADHFNQTQGGTMTPNGSVVTGSAHDTGDGTITYGTEDGSTFEVTPRPTPDEGYRYTNPQKIESGGE